jgi:hypothetical protein
MLLLHDNPRLSIQRARLVHEQRLGVQHIGARDRNALLHPARELMRERRLVPLEPHQLDDPGHPIPASVWRNTLVAQAKGDVVRHALPREQRELLEDNRPVGTSSAPALRDGHTALVPETCG